MRVAVLAKQVPSVEDMGLDEKGRLTRVGVGLEMNAYCRRAVAKGVEIAAAAGGTCVVFSLGPPVAEDVLREAVAWGADQGVLLSDPAFAGSDTLATARALAAALDSCGPFDLVLVGRNSTDADTGQVGPEVAELLDLPFVACVRELHVSDGAVEARCEHDDTWKEVRVNLPAVLSVAERLTEPCKVPPEGRAAVPVERLRRVSARELGPGPWGAAGSPTMVGAVRVMDVRRHHRKLSGSTQEQVRQAVEALGTWGALPSVSQSLAVSGGHGAVAWNQHAAGVEVVPASVVSKRWAPAETANASREAPTVAVIAEPDRLRLTRELLGEAAFLARDLGGTVTVVGPVIVDLDSLGAWGADVAVELSGALVEEDVASGLVALCRASPPWCVLAPGTLWGREVAARVAARLEAGLTGDAVAFEVQESRLVSWKPVFGGRLLAPITSNSEVQLATVRPGALALRKPRVRSRPTLNVASTDPRRRVSVTSSTRYDDLDVLLSARSVVALGAGVAPDEYERIVPLSEVLDAELAATRKVTDQGWLPRSRQVGITGYSVSPAIYVAIGVSGKFNHMVGARSAGIIVAINSDASAPIFEWADLGIVADWHEAVPLLVAALDGSLNRE
jgi:electron transfer flavoprotein alpha subunit